jgi:polysaccharide export outer membrane protein
MKRIPVLSVVLLFCFIHAFGQQDTAGISTLKSESESLSRAPGSRVLLAIASPDYPVTPGDVYSATYVRMNVISSIEGIVESDYTLNLSILGRINVKGLTYPKLRARLDALILDSYPASKPRIMLLSTGIFRVLVKGEVEKAELVQCWGLSRLSEAIQNRTTQFSSLRTITIVSADGKTRQCDLFLSTRNGALDQDPYVKPDDTIVIPRAKRKVTVSGAVHKAGTYELLDGESLKEAVEVLGDGPTDDASQSGIVITRRIRNEKNPAKTFYVDASGGRYPEFVFENDDEIFVPSTLDNLPFVYFEGAVDADTQARDALVKSPGRIGYRITPGELLSSAVRDVRKSFSDLALFEDAYIIREGETNVIPVNIESLLEGKPGANDVPLVRGDRVVVPIRQYFVTVSGAVVLPGRYPYVPNRSYLYYISCAGGFDSQKNAGQNVTILDARDKVLAHDRVIQPEDRINAEVNNLGFYINQWVPVVSMTVSVATLVIAVAQLLKLGQ